MHFDFICECSNKKMNATRNHNDETHFKKNAGCKRKGTAELAKRIKQQSLDNAFSSIANASKRKRARGKHK